MSLAERARREGPATRNRIPNHVLQRRIALAGALSASLFAAACAPEGDALYDDGPGDLGKADGPGLDTELDEQLLSWAVAAAELAHSEGHGLGHPDLLTIVDFSKSSAHKRLWVVDTSAHEILFNERAAHGRNSGNEYYATSFSNRIDSYQSSLGFIEANETGVGSSVGPYIALDGLEAGFNHNVRTREILVHGATYVSQEYYEEHGHIGQSLGCVSVRPDIIDEIMDTISGGSLMLLYYPDDDYLQNSRFLSPVMPWVGSACEPGDDDVCDFSYGNATGACYDDGGYCIMSCEGICADRYGHATTFCVASPDGGGMCVPKSEEANDYCADIPGTAAQTRQRYVGGSGASVTSAVVCVPAA